MSIAAQTTTCTLCRRTVTGPHIIRGLGAVGPSCKEKVAGLERAFEVLDGLTGYPGDLKGYQGTLLSMGYTSKLVPVGERNGSTVYRVQPTGTVRNFDATPLVKAREAFSRQLERMAA